MKNDVISRLLSFGYAVAENDEWLIDFSVQKVEISIKNNCNTNIIPDGLSSIAIDMACGEFLTVKKQSGTLIGFDVESVIKSIKLGDSDVSFEKNQSTEDKLDSLIYHLLNYGKGDLSCYRKIKW